MIVRSVIHLFYVNRVVAELIISPSLFHGGRAFFIRYLFINIKKSVKRLNVIDKSIIVILNKLTDGKLKSLKRSKKVQCY